MEQFVGLDVSQEFTHVCVVDHNGEKVWQGRCASTPEAIAEVIESKAPGVARIGLESGPLSTWHWHALNARNLPVVCLDARNVQAALSLQVNKTDKNDAYGLAQIVRMGWYRAVGVKSLQSHAVRSMLGARAQLVGMRTECINQIRGILKNFGIVLGKSKGIHQPFEQQVEELSKGDALFSDAVRALLAVLRSLGEQVRRLDRQVQSYARKHPVCRHLMSVPGIGMFTAVAFVAAVDDPGRFQKSRSVGAFFGLTPRRYQSGETDVVGRISKCGEPDYALLLRNAPLNFCH